MPAQVFEETQHLGVTDRMEVKLQIELGPMRDRRNGRKIDALIGTGINHGRLTLGGPSACDRRFERKTAFVKKDKGCAQGAGFFLMRGQVFLSQVWMACSLRSWAFWVGR